MKKKVLLLFLFSGWLISCSPFSREITRQFEENHSLREIQKNPQLHIGKKVLWGGVILETKNKKGETLLEVIQTELDIQKRPVNLDHSSGRFLVLQAGFLDPAIYQKGREITVAGEIVGQEVFPLGETQYTYPILAAQEIHLWDKPEEVMPAFPYGYRYPPHWWHPYPFGWYGPYW